MDGTGPKSQPNSPIRTGQAALARGAWREALHAFQAALAQEETHESLEGLGLAAARLDEAPLLFEARERAYPLYLDAGDRRSAARVAIALAKDYFSLRGEPAVANGWLQRARRLLEGLEPSPEFGWLALCEAHVAVYEFDATTALRCSAQALALGRELDDVDLEMLALAYQGLALVLHGTVDEGMRCLDEATTAVVAGEMTDADATCTACCCLIYACQQVRDYARAAQWCKRLEALAQRWSYRGMFSVCRSYYGALLMGQGAWDKAEAELTAALQAMAAARPAQAAEGLVCLAELYRRQGRSAEAADLFGQAALPPYRALAGNFYLLGQAALALEGDDAETAVDLAERFLRVTPAEAQITRVPALELLVQAWVACGQLDPAQARLDELRTAVATIPTRPMQASVRFAEGLIAAAAGAPDTARPCFEDALELWAQSGAPIETAQARLELARVLAELGRLQTAEQEARAALASLHALGAAGLAAHAAALLNQIHRALDQTTGAPAPRPALTDRQVEVLRLVVQGLSNKEIAAQLVVSEHTVHRHIANILGRLDVSSRAAAAAYAARHDLI